MINYVIGDLKMTDARRQTFYYLPGLVRDQVPPPRNHIRAIFEPLANRFTYGGDSWSTCKQLNDSKIHSFYKFLVHRHDTILEVHTRSERQILWRSTFNIGVLIFNKYPIRFVCLDIITFICKKCMTIQRKVTVFKFLSLDPLKWLN